MASFDLSIQRAGFGKMPDGTLVELFTLRNHSGTEVQITNYGGIVTSLKVADKREIFADVVFGFDKLEDYTGESYLKSGPYFGAIIGRYTNRIAGGKFVLNGKTYTLAKNNGNNALHGGLKGFDKVVWEIVSAQTTERGAELKLAYTSRDGEEGYPGNLKILATYTLTQDNTLDNTLRLDFEAATDQPTICNLTNHTYFNLAGRGDILNHVASINAKTFTPANANLTPTGELRSVEKTPLDFLQPTPIGLRINDTGNEQIRLAKGYDHNFVLNKKAGELALAARVREPDSGRALEVWATAPGVQFYTGNFLNGAFTGKGGWTYQARDGFCFEPQFFPDSPNQPQFPSAELKLGEIYRQTILYKFFAE